MVVVKKIFLMFCILITMFSACSCLKPVQLNERAIVQAIAIDYDNEKKLFNLTYQVFSPNTGGGGNIGATAENAKIIESSGITISEAIQNATLVQGKQLFVGHNRIIILGKKTAELNLKQSLGYFVNNPDSRKNVNVVIAEDKASDILKAKINQGMLPAETLQKIVENANENGIIENVKLFEFVKALDDDNESAVIPIIKVNKQNAEGSGGNSEKSADQNAVSGEKETSEKIEEVSSISMDGMAVIANQKFKTKLNKEESRGVLWIRNQINNTSINAITDKVDSAAVEIYKSKTKITPQISADDKIKFIVNIKCKATLGEVKIKEGETIVPNDIKSIQKASGLVVEDECKKAFDTVFKQNKSDAFFFGKILYHENAELWDKIQSKWQDMPDKIDIEVTANIDIDRVGLEFPTE